MATDIVRDDVQRLLDEGAQLVDVRPEQEFGEEHIAGAINVPLKTLDATAAAVLDKNKPVVVY